MGNPRKVDIRLPGKRILNSHGARPVHYNYLDYLVDSDQYVVNKELSRSIQGGRAQMTTRKSDIRIEPSLGGHDSAV